MNPDHPPLTLLQPETAQRRRERSHPVPTAPEIVARRVEIAGRLQNLIAPLNARLRTLTDEERRAIFVKVEHDGPISLERTGLKAIAEPTDHFTLAIPRRDNLDAFEKRLVEFGTGPVKHSMVPNAQLARIQSIAEADPKDRLSQDLFDNYEALINKDLLVLEIELLSVVAGATKQRNELQKMRHALVTALGTQGTIFEQEEIKGTCRAVIRCTGAQFQNFVEEPVWRTRITWFEARPEFQTFYQIVQNFSVDQLGPLSSPEATASTVCIVDSGVTAGNPFLSRVTRNELIKSFLKSAPDNPSDEYENGHGSGVASLVSYYALNLAPGANNEGKIWVASARVLNENNQGDEGLFSKVLCEVVDFFVPHGVKVFNLSVNILNRRWNNDAKRTVPRRSWIARTLDRLSRERDVIFVISAGNILAGEVRSLIRDGHSYPAYFVEEDTRILDPAQAALAITVGAIAPTTLAVGPVGRARAIAERGHASPFTRSGPGINREVKPELVEYGGNYLLDEESGIVRHNNGSSVVMASNKLTPAVVYDAGTSFSAARTSHKLAVVQGDLRWMGIEPSSALLKCFLVNSARLPIEGEELETFCLNLGGGDPKHYLNVLGYGIPDDVRATGCDPYSVLLFHQGTIEPDKIVFFDVPVPVSLENAIGKKRLTVTVCHTPEVQRWGLEQYLGTTLKWRMFRGDVTREEVIGAMSLPDEVATEQPTLPDELKFKLGIQLRSRGTVQHDVFEWTTHRPEYSANHYTLAVTAYEKWGRLARPHLPLAVVVRLEELSRTQSIYTEVENALIGLEVQANIRT